MIIKTATTIYFSPTGTTKKIINATVKGMNIICENSIDLTLSKVRNSDDILINGDIVLIGVPVYEETIPRMIVPFLNKLNGNRKPVVLIAVYGNFGYGIILNELDFIAKNSGFKVVAAGLFIGEHSFSTNEAQVQEGRPNYEDLSMAEEFGKSIMKKLHKIQDLSNIVLNIPKGRLPLMARILPKNSARLFTKTPLADMHTCSKCGICEKLCPMNAIDKKNLIINEKECIRCFSCVKRCPKKARKIIYKHKFLVTRVLKARNKIKNNPKCFYMND